MIRIAQGLCVLLSTLALAGCSRTRQANGDFDADSAGCEAGERGCPCDVDWDCDADLLCSAGRCRVERIGDDDSEPFPMTPVPQPPWPDPVMMMLPPPTEPPPQFQPSPPPTEPPAFCGNGIREWNEDCDAPTAGTCIGADGRIVDVLCTNCRRDFSQCGDGVPSDIGASYCGGFQLCGWFGVADVTLCLENIGPDCEQCVTDTVVDFLQSRRDEDGGVVNMADPCAVPIDEACVNVCANLNPVDL